MVGQKEVPEARKKRGGPKAGGPFRKPPAFGLAFHLKGGSSHQWDVERQKGKGPKPLSLMRLVVFTFSLELKP